VLRKEESGDAKYKENLPRKQLANRVSEANGIGTQTSVADTRNGVISVQGGATNHAHTDVGV
ncbi:hypothetical protein Tco_0274201, partial [Tanacetum coccineum]